jgi:hypothetical protein
MEKRIVLRVRELPNRLGLNERKLSGLMSSAVEGRAGSWID